MIFSPDWIDDPYFPARVGNLATSLANYPEVSNISKVIFFQLFVGTWHTIQTDHFSHIDRPLFNGRVAMKINTSKPSKLE
jgi:hypothetical protein